MEIRDALHDALLAVGVQPKHVRDRKDVDAFAEEMKANKQAMEMAAAAEQGGNAMRAVAEGQAALETV
jgi:hypothetical protein